MKCGSTAGSAIYPSLAGKRVVITGSGLGIGAGQVEAFARQGDDFAADLGCYLSWYPHFDVRERNAPSYWILPGPTKFLSN